MRLILLMLCVVFCLGAAPQQRPPDPGSPRKPIRVLVITGGHDFERDAFFAMFQAMPGVEWREAVQPQANSLYTPEEAAKYDVIVLYDMVQEITEEQKSQFVRLLKQGGKGLVGLHHCIGDYQKWPEFRRILGGRYYMSRYDEEGVTHDTGTYDHDQHFTVQIADPRHPITRGMKEFAIEDETYKGFYVNRNAKALLRVDHPKSAPVIGWAHEYGKTRVAYLQLGHGPTAFANENYRLLICNAIRWAARAEK